MEGGVRADVHRLIAGCSAAGSAPALGEYAQPDKKLNNRV